MAACLVFRTMILQGGGRGGRDGKVFSIVCLSCMYYQCYLAKNRYPKAENYLGCLTTFRVQLSIIRINSTTPISLLYVPIYIPISLLYIPPLSMYIPTLYPSTLYIYLYYPYSIYIPTLYHSTLYVYPYYPYSISQVFNFLYTFLTTSLQRMVPMCPGRCFCIVQ